MVAELSVHIINRDGRWYQGAVLKGKTNRRKSGGEYGREAERGKASLGQ